MRYRLLALILLILSTAPVFAESPYALMPVTLVQGEAQYTGVMLFQPETGRSWILDKSEGKPPAWIPVGFELTPGISTQNLPPRLHGSAE